MKVHLSIDLLAGIFLAASPWLRGFSHRVMAPHLIFGLLEMGAALMTRQIPRLGRVAPALSMDAPPGGMPQMRQ